MLYRVLCAGNVSPVPMSGSPPVPDKFTMRSSQTLNLAKKGSYVFYSPFSQAYSVPDKFTMRSSQTLNLAKKGNHDVCLFPFLTSLFST